MSSVQAITKQNRFIDTTGPVRLVGRWSWLTAVLGYGNILLTAAILVLGMPYGYEVVRQTCEKACYIKGQLNPENVRDLKTIGISTDTYALIFVLVLSLFALISFGVSGLILWKKPGELMPLCAALFISGLPAVEGQFVFFSNFFDDYPILGFLYQLTDVLSPITLVYLFVAFPSGKFKSKVLFFIFVAGGLVPTAIYTLGFLIFPDITSGSDTEGPVTAIAFALTLVGTFGWMATSFFREKNRSLPNIGKYLIYALPCIAVAFVTFYLSGGFTPVAITLLLILLYRSFRVLTPAERVSTKWLIYGFVVLLGVTILFSPLGRLGTYWFLLFNFLGFFGCGITLTATLMSVLYANAFDINLVIKRTIVYSALTLLIAGIYIGSVVGLQALVRAFTGQENDLAIVGATLVSIILFQPLRKYIQEFVDRRFYRQKYDTARTIAELSEQLKHEMDLKTLSVSLQGVLNETLQPELVTVWLKKKV